MGGTSGLFATPTPTPAAVPISDGSGTLRDWDVGQVNPQSGTTYDLVFDDRQNTITFSNGSGCVVTIPDNGTEPFPVNTQIILVALTAGVVQVVAGGGVTLIVRAGADKLAGLGAIAILLQTAIDEWVFNGDTTA